MTSIFFFLDVWKRWVIKTHKVQSQISFHLNREKWVVDKERKMQVTAVQIGRWEEIMGCV